MLTFSLITDGETELDLLLVAEQFHCCLKVESILSVLSRAFKCEARTICLDEEQIKTI